MSDETLDDRIIIERLQAGEPEALGDLYDCYHHQIYRTALAITHDPTVADDITQECFLRVFHYAHRIDSSLSLSPWLYRVTVNLSYTWIKRNKRHKLSLEGFIDRLTAPPKHAPETVAERTELQESVQTAIDALPFGQKVVIVLHYLNGMNLQEIADILDCPLGTVKSRLYHARQNLKDKLGEPKRLSDIAHGYNLLP